LHDLFHVTGDGLVEGNEIGVCVQVDGYDLDRLQNDVVFRDNTSSLDATRLPVPDVTVPSVEP